VYVSFSLRINTVNSLYQSVTTGMVGCTRSSLNVMASEKGVVVGKLQFRDDGDLIDCSLMGVSGKNIPSFMDRVSDIRLIIVFPSIIFFCGAIHCRPQIIIRQWRRSVHPSSGERRCIHASG
jgi:hypothetical protein